MSNDIFVITEHMDGAFADISYEMVGKAKEIASSWGGQVVAVVLGSGVAANTFGSDSTVYVDDANLAQFNPEAYGKVIEALVQEKSPCLVLFGWTAIGMDLAAWQARPTFHSSGVIPRLNVVETLSHCRKPVQRGGPCDRGDGQRDGARWTIL